MGDEGCIAILTAIKHSRRGLLYGQTIELPSSWSPSTIQCDGVSVLGLIGNKVSDATAQYAAELIADSSCSITRLYLNENNIADDGAVALAEALLHSSLESSSSSSSSSFSSTPLSTTTTTTTTTTSRSSGRYRSFERLGLSDNRIGSQGGEHLANALASGLTTIEKLCASDNPFGAATFAKLSKLPNAFVGAKSRKGRTNQILDGKNCRVMVLWQPKYSHHIVAMCTEEVREFSYDIDPITESKRARR
jgi:hypothetical protein